MKLVEDQTRFTHKTKVTWGEGVFRRYEGNYIIIEFETEGEKKFSIEAIGDMLVPMAEISDTNTLGTSVSVTENHLLQFDGEAELLGGKNIIPAFDGDNTILFNESYTVVGLELRANKIHAMYDLTIIGDLEVSECVVNGSLLVTGNVTADSMNCANICVIQGTADIKKIYVGGDFIADSVNCDDISVEGNAVVRTTIDVNCNAKIEKTVVACEGIMGAGAFSAVNAIANEYFEFEGDVSGRILELDTDTTISKLVPPQAKEEGSLSDLIVAANKIIDREYDKCPGFEEEDVIEALGRIETDTSHGWINGPDNRRLFAKLVDISYKEKIETVEEYLYVLLAKKTLPAGLYSYETVEFVDSLVPNAEKDFDNLQFAPNNIESFVVAVDLAQRCLDVSGIEFDILFDKLFGAIGLKYNTVRTILHRNGTAVNDSNEKCGNDFDVADGQDFESQATTEVPVVPKESREEFLKKKITHLARKYGITNPELERLTAIKVRTCEDFVSLTDEAIENAYGRKAFLAKHLIMVKNKMVDKVNEML